MQKVGSISITPSVSCMDFDLGSDESDSARLSEMKKLQQNLADMVGTQSFGPTMEIIPELGTLE